MLISGVVMPGAGLAQGGERILRIV